MERCKREAPELALVEGRQVACHLYSEDARLRAPAKGLGNGALGAPAPSP
jgi:hypothetical protein